MLTNILPEKPLKSISDGGSAPTPTAGQLATLIDGQTGLGYVFGGSGYSANLCTGGTATSSTAYAPYYASYAFNGSADENGLPWMVNADTSLPAWIKYQFPAAKKICKLRFCQPAVANHRIKNYTVEGSNDNSAWDSLFSGQAANGGGWQEQTFANATAYLYVRMNITGMWAGWIYMYELEMMEAAPNDLKVTVDATGGGAHPLAEVRYRTTETDASRVAISTSSDGASWTARSVSWSGGAYLKAAVVAEARYIKIEHNPSGQVTAWEIEAMTSRPYAYSAGRYGVCRVSRRTAHARYNAGWLQPATAWRRGGYGVCGVSRTSSRGGYHVTQSAVRRERAQYSNLQSSGKAVLATYHVRPPEVRWCSPFGGGAVDILQAGVLTAGEPFGEFELDLQNDLDGTSGVLKMSGLRLTVSLADGGYAGGDNFIGQEAVTGKWISARSSGTAGARIADDAQSALTPIGGEPSVHGLALGDLPGGAARKLHFKINVPDNPATFFRTVPHLRVSYDAAPWPGHGEGFGEYFGG